ncbi:MAG: DUF5681 domain-containing protein [Acidobacteriota bacterium]|jgi:hypothetical protein
MAKKKAIWVADAESQRGTENLRESRRGKNPNSLRNLRKWKPGQSGNPKGSVKNEHSLTSLLRKELEAICPADQKGRSWKELIVEAMMRLAIKGNSTAINTVFERIEGKVKDEVDHSGTVKVVEIPATAKDEEEWEAECRAEYDRRNATGTSVAGTAGPPKVAS